jgi:predicted NAD/FAD-binding protein
MEWPLGAVFAQKKNAFSADFLLMIREIVRFGKEAPEVLRESPNSRHAEFGWMTLGQYLARRGYSRFFTENYVVPMCAAIWSCSDRDTLDFPVVTLVRFWVNHHLLNLVERPLWRVVRGRSEAYVDAIVRAITREDFDGGRRGVVELDARVVAVKRKSYGVAVYWTREGGSRPGEITKCEYDDVIFACHSDQALAILGEEAKDAERAALDAIKARYPYTGSHTTALAWWTPFLKDFSRCISPPNPRFQSRHTSTPFNSN